MKTIRDFRYKNKRVLVRCDFDVPCDKKGEICDDFRIKQSIATIKYLLKKQAKVILMGHLGRPGGKVVENMRLDKIQARLIKYLNILVVKAEDCIGKEIIFWTKIMKPGEVLLLENLRFHKEEEENNKNFSKELSKLGDIYINNAFAVSHRCHASVVCLSKFLPSGAGLLLEKEVNSLKKILKNFKKPLIAIIGGKKVETKLNFINTISPIADFILVGRLIQKEMEEKNISFKFPQKIIKPIDVKGDDEDIGEKTINIFEQKLKKAMTIFWNGPLGRIEENKFQYGTEKIAKIIAESKAFSLIGGGETVEFINRIGLTEKFGYISTGGGAMFAFLSGEKMPALEALN